MAEVGDLVNYNVAGMAKHSLGIVIDKKVFPSPSHNLTFYKIAWQRLGIYAPKIAKRYVYADRIPLSQCMFLSDGWSGTNVRQQAEINHPEWFEATTYDCFPKIKMNKN